MKKLILLLLGIFLLVGCSSDNSNDGLISYMDAKEKIINEEAILIDVRTEDEYNEEHIDGAILFTLDDITEESAQDIIRNKNSVVIVYCRSGNRSSQAVSTLENLGYTKVYDLGAMSNWEE